MVSAKDNLKIKINRIITVYSKMCKDVFDDDEQKLMTDIAIVDDYEKLNGLYTSLIPISTKIEEKLKNTQNPVCVKDDNTMKDLCLDGTTIFELDKMEPLICEVKTGGKKRRNKSRKTGKKRSRKHTKKQRR